MLWLRDRIPLLDGMVSCWVVGGEWWREGCGEGGFWVWEGERTTAV